MRKEIILAVFLGVLLGGIILYGTIVANKAVSDATPSPTPTTTLLPTNSQKTPAPSTSTEKPIITFPFNNFVSTTDSITISGTAPKNTPLAVLSEKDETIINSDKDGKFETEVKLVGGENQITLSFPTQPEITTLPLTIIYTTAEIKI